MRQNQPLPSSHSNARQRPRWTWIWAVALTVAAGLISRSHLVAPLLPPVLRKGVGDALWAAMVFFLLGLMLPRASSRIALGAVTLSFADEFSQIYQSPWLNHLRANPLGHLILGSGFNAADLIWYCVGVSLAALVETRLLSSLSVRLKRPGPANHL